LITGDSFATIALSFPGVETTPHFDRTGFKVMGKRMFATYLAGNVLQEALFTAYKMVMASPKRKG
jgi:hypothetical protein